MSTDFHTPTPGRDQSGSPASEQGSALAPMLRKLNLWQKLSAKEEAAVLALPYEAMTIDSGRYIVREGDKATRSCLLVNGFAFRQKMTRDGARSILAVHMRGDIVDLQNSLLGHADHSVQALGRAQVAYIPRDAVREIAFEMPNVGMAMWYDTLVDASIFREWILNIARRNALARISHLICEFGVRIEALGLGTRDCYEFPMTQDQLADATGLTSVHVNRTLMSLESAGLIERSVRHIVVAEWGRLATAGEFDDTYLHLPK